MKKGMSIALGMHTRLFRNKTLMKIVKDFEMARLWVQFTYTESDLRVWPITKYWKHE